MTLYKKPLRDPQEVTLLLFTDLLLIVKQKRADFYQMIKLPIPLEESVFLDKPDTSSLTLSSASSVKHLFQIIHMQQEIHTFQTRSRTDKSTWLEVAEEQRLGFCLGYIEFEGLLLRDKADRSQMECILDDADSISITDTLKRTATMNESVSRGENESVSNAGMLFFWEIMKRDV